jgi:hypothetical protein
LKQQAVRAGYSLVIFAKPKNGPLISGFLRDWLHEQPLHLVVVNIVYDIYICCAYYFMDLFAMLEAMMLQTWHDLSSLWTPPLSSD